VQAHVAGPYQPCGIVGTGPVSWGAASPTDPAIAAASRSGVVLFFDLDTGKRIRTPFYAGGPVSSVDYARDGKRLVVAGDTGVEIVNVADGRVLWSGKPFAVSSRSAALSPDGTLIAALGVDEQPIALTFPVTLRILRVADGALIAQRSVDGPDGVAPQFSPEGTFVVVGAELLSVASLDPLPISPLQVSGNASLSPDGKMIAMGGHVWNVASGQELKAAPTPSPLLSWAAFSPDGVTYAESLSEFAGLTIHRYRTSDWSLVDTAVISPSTSPNGRFFFSGDGGHLISTAGPAVDLSNRLAFSVVGVPDFAGQTLIAEPWPFWAGPAVFAPDGSLVASRLQNSSAVFRISDLSLASSFGGGSQQYGFLGNGMVDVIPSRLYDPSSGQMVGLAPGYWPAISPDGRLAVTLAGAQALITRLADLTTQATLATGGRLPQQNNTNTYAFSRDNRFVALVVDGPPALNVLVFDAATGAVVTTVAGGAPIALATTAGGAGRLAGAIDQVTTRVWSIPDGTPLFDIDRATAVDFSPDGSLIAAAGDDGIRIFAAATGVLRETLRAHADPFAQQSGATWVAFSPTGQIASVGMDEALRFWCSP
jgi:WD40 repeat protein